MGLEILWFWFYKDSAPDGAWRGDGCRVEVVGKPKATLKKM
jgi:hypothetical protein